MSSKTRDPAAVQTRLWDEIRKTPTGMLGLMDGEDRHFQPMTAFVEPETNQIWFFTYKDTDLAESTGAGSNAMFVVQQKDFKACIGGRLSLSHDAGRIEKYWNAEVAAWYPDGKTDPHLTLLRFDLDDAKVWISEGGVVRHAWEVAKANATNTRPDGDDRTHIHFH